MKIITVIGARPQFIKAAPVSRKIRETVEEKIIHTGQHYDTNMSDIFFEELNIPKPDYRLTVSSPNHGAMTGDMLKEIEQILLDEKPDYVLVYGDTNSTLAGALAASKLHIPLIHIEAGLRSFNKKMPEEINRVLTDHVSELLICPTDTAVNNLEKESVTRNVYNLGDVMYDAVLYNQEIANEKSTILADLQLTKKDYYLITIHRAENTDDLSRMESILEAFKQIEGIKVWPIHPRTKQRLMNYGVDFSAIPGLQVVDPVGYLDMLALETSAKKIITDSGGVQKEAYFAHVPCITVRDETEWVETLVEDANQLTGVDTDKIVAAVKKDVAPSYKPLFGDGDMAGKLKDLIESHSLKN